MRNYCMIIGDIVSSKNIKPQDRYSIQEKLKQELEKINFDYDQVICSRFCITLGDELQGGLVNSIYLFKIINRIKKCVSPYKMRFGIGFGDLITDVVFFNSFSTDGPAYHNAREAISELKEQKTYEYGYKVKSTHNDTCIINSLLEVVDSLSSSWTDSQKYYVDMSIEAKCDLKTLANYLNISVSTLSRTLSRANYKLIKNALENLETNLYDNFDKSDTQITSIIEYNIACKKFENNDFKASIEALNKVIAENKIDNLNKILLLAMNYTAIGEEKKAISFAAKGLEFIEIGYIQRRIRLYNIIGINYTNLGCVSYAEDAFNQALELVKNDSNPTTAIWYIYTMGNKARLYRLQKEYDKAELIYIKMLKMLEDYFENDKYTPIQVISNLAYIYIKKHKYQEAYELLENILKKADVYLDKKSKTVATIKLHIAEAIIGLCNNSQSENLELQERAYKLLEEALKAFEIINYKQAIKECYEFFVKLSNSVGDKIKIKYYSEQLSKIQEE